MFSSTFAALVNYATRGELSSAGLNEYMYIKQVAQLLHRHRAAGWVSCGHEVEDWNWKTIFYEHYRPIFNHCDIIGQQSNRIR